MAAVDVSAMLYIKECQSCGLQVSPPNMPDGTLGKDADCCRNCVAVCLHDGLAVPCEYRQCIRIMLFPSLIIDGRCEHHVRAMLFLSRSRQEPLDSILLYAAMAALCPIYLRRQQDTEDDRRRS